MYLEQMIDAFEPRLVDEDEVVIKQARALLHGTLRALCGFDERS
jgi:hypothetical protein